MYALRCYRIMSFQFLISGLDTVEVCYYLQPGAACEVDFLELEQQREALRVAKKRQPKVVTFGGVDFLLRPRGSANGFPFIIENRDIVVEFGEFKYAVLPRQVSE